MDNMETTITSDRRFAIVDEWVLDLPVSDRAIRLYAVLVRYADHQTHKAFPSRRTLAERLRCSMKSVDRAVQELIDAGALSKEQRFNSSLVFTIHTVWSGLSRGVDTGDEGGWTPESRGVDTGDDLTITTKPEPKEQEPLNAQFDQFWSVYPRKEAKAKAREAFTKAVEKYDVSLIIAGAVSYRDDPNREPGFTTHATTWLNQQRWEDDPLPSKAKKTANEHNLELLAKIQAEESAKAENSPKMIDTPDFGGFLRRIDD
jgi:hypothetical protein